MQNFKIMSEEGQESICNTAMEETAAATTTPLNDTTNVDSKPMNEVNEGDGTGTPKDPENLDSTLDSSMNDSQSGSDFGNFFIIGLFGPFLVYLESILCPFLSIYSRFFVFFCMF